VIFKFAYASIFYVLRFVLLDKRYYFSTKGTENFDYRITNIVLFERDMKSIEDDR
jgi:hypothetical protein